MNRISTKTITATPCAVCQKETHDLYLLDTNEVSGAKDSHPQWGLVAICSVHCLWQYPPQGKC